MDLHLIPGAAPTDAERAAVDRLLGPAPTAWQGGDRASSDMRSARGGEAARGRRHLLLPVLEAVQARGGWISPGALNYVCQRLTVPPAEAFGVASFYALLSTEPRPPRVLHVCDDIACRTAGAEQLCAELEARLGPAGKPSPDGGATWLRSPCLGFCERAPAAFLQITGEEPREWTTAPADTGALVAELRAGRCQRAPSSTRGAPRP